MSTITTDFLGSYDWPAEEAKAVSEIYLFMADSGDYSKDKLHQKVIKEREHWLKVFGNDDQGKEDMRRFSEVFNQLCADKIGCFM